MKNPTDTPTTSSPDVKHHVRVFLEALAAGGGKPLEQLPHEVARAVLAKAQASVKLDLPKGHMAEKSISVDGQDLKLTIVRPAGVKQARPVFMFFHGGGWVLGDFDPRAPGARLGGGFRRRGGVRELYPVAGSTLPHRH
jgi:acetyl esterase/lipase